MKKFLAVALCAVLLLVALPERASAEAQAQTQEQAIIKEARRVYRYSLSSSGKESFAGYCGLMTSHQLWHMGINADLEVYDGNRQFDIYAAREQTTGGYYVKDYPATEYTLEQALNAITHGGSWDAYNILVGFQRTNTASGAYYGHACIINAILDGTVYFVESFYTSLGGPEGNVIQCSIKEFADYFADWTTFEGVIHFGSKRYADSCQFFGTDIFVRTRFDSNLRSEPCLLAENGCVRLRSLAAGEVLHATAVCVNSQGELYYYIEDGEHTGFVTANAVSLVRLNGEDLSLTDVSIPRAVKKGTDFVIDGTVAAGNSSVGLVEIVITDAFGNPVMRQQQEVNDIRFCLGELNEQMDLDKLTEGTYQVSVYADATCVIAKGTQPCEKYTRIQLLQQPLWVNADAAEGRERPMSQPIQDGWVWENGTWYLYDQGKTCSGWVEELGVRYYLAEDGAVAVGWTEIDGQLYYFSATGAMCTGWLTTQGGTSYRLPDGAMAVGWHVIDTDRYYFDEEGLLVTQGTVMDGQVAYRFQPDGRAVLDIQTEE